MTKYAIVRAIHQIWIFFAIAARFPEIERSITFWIWTRLLIVAENYRICVDLEATFA
jgi:hypothetical protein